MKSSATIADLAGLAVDAEDVVADLGLGLVALVVRHDPVGRIGEPDRVVGLHHHVVRAVQPLALVAVGDDRDAAVMLGARDAPPAVLARDEPSLPVDGVAVRVAARLAEDADRAVGLVVAHDPVVRDVGEQRGSARPGNRPAPRSSARRSTAAPRGRCGSRRSGSARRRPRNRWQPFGFSREAKMRLQVTGRGEG